MSGSLDRLIKKEKISEADKSAGTHQDSTSYDDLKSAQLVIGSRDRELRAQGQDPQAARRHAGRT